ncbi:helix-turn-helix domain-containing protein [Pseudomonas sp. NPDC089407]|uniref:helix-turn-helix domain-containing protein n=1 Tax=Pseudomonas sp. NPDC089407 TaxID=3364464 RepID=UPI00384AAEAF
MATHHFQLIEVVASAPSTLLLTFAEGQQYTVVIDEVIEKHAALRPLADPKVFATAAIGAWKDTVIWAGDDNLELAADNLHARALEQTGDCSHELIWNWMARHELSLARAAEQMGVSSRKLSDYLRGEKPVPKSVALAMARWEACQRAMGAVPAHRI